MSAQARPASATAGAADGQNLASRLSAATADPASPAELARRRAALAYIPFAGTAR
jgi:hypothetical protein